MIQREDRTGVTEVEATSLTQRPLNQLPVPKMHSSWPLVQVLPRGWFMSKPMSSTEHSPIIHNSSVHYVPNTTKDSLKVHSKMSVYKRLLGLFQFVPVFETSAYSM